MATARDMRDMPTAELRDHVGKLRRDLLGLRFANATGELEDTAGLGAGKRELARALTVLHERELTSTGLTGN
ncbi:MAG: 50S ribosomal protein L29 [Solirubrobacteraceae bacterium]